MTAAGAQGSGHAPQLQSLIRRSGDDLTCSFVWLPRFEIRMFRDSVSGDAHLAGSAVVGSANSFV
jgi:hypothetical protein